MITTAADAKKFRDDMESQARVQQTFSYTARVQAEPGTVTTVNLPISDGADFQMLGYNMEYDAAQDGKEHLRVQFSQKVGNRRWSNDFEPIKSIATPGVRLASAPPARYGYRLFPGRLKANDQVTIQVENTAAEALEVCITFVGVLWFIQ